MKVRDAVDQLLRMDPGADLVEFESIEPIRFTWVPKDKRVYVDTEDN